MLFLVVLLETVFSNRRYNISIFVLKSMLAFFFNFSKIKYGNSLKNKTALERS